MNERKFVKTSFWFVKSIKLFLVIFLLCVFCALMVFNSSCSSSSASETSKIDVESSNENQKSQTDKGQSKEESGTTESTKETTEEESVTSSSEMVTTTTKEGLTIRVYYADAETIYLVGEERLVKGSHKYFEAFIELMKPPITPGLIKLIPDTAKVNKITKDDSNIDIDLSQSFINDRFKSDSVDMLLIYSIVNTMTEFPEINTVTFHFDGKKADTFGQMDLSESFYRDTSLIKKNN